MRTHTIARKSAAAPLTRRSLRPKVIAQCELGERIVMSVATQLPAGPDTVFAAFQAAAMRHAQKPFIAVLSETAKAYDIAPGELNYGRVRAEVERLAAAYRKGGYGHGHRVGVLLENRPDFFLHWFA